MHSVRQASYIIVHGREREDLIGSAHTGGGNAPAIKPPPDQVTPVMRLYTSQQQSSCTQKRTGLVSSACQSGLNFTCLYKYSNRPLKPSNPLIGLWLRVCAVVHSGSRHGTQGMCSGSRNPLINLISSAFCCRRALTRTAMYTTTKSALTSPPAYCDEKVANREIRVWHFVIENGY
jgi:hypothetical protein